MRSIIAAPITNFETIPSLGSDTPNQSIDFNTVVTTCAMNIWNVVTSLSETSDSSKATPVL